MAKPIITCKLTGVTGPAVEAHVIPRSLYQLDGTFAQIIDINGDSYRESLSRIGEYDDSIVTAEGEKHFRDCDDYAARFFLNSKSENSEKVGTMYLDPNGKPMGTVLEPGDFDAHKIRMLGLTILWRASVSQRPLFRSVDVGSSHEASLRKLILSGNSGDPRDYTVILLRWEDTPKHGLAIFKPHRSRRFGRNGYMFYLGQFLIWIKTDRQKFDERYVCCTVRGDSKLLIMMMGAFFESPLGLHARRLVGKHLAQQAEAKGLTLDEFMQKKTSFLRNGR